MSISNSRVKAKEPLLQNCVIVTQLIYVSISTKLLREKNNMAGTARGKLANRK